MLFPGVLDAPPAAEGKRAFTGPAQSLLKRGKSGLSNQSQEGVLQKLNGAAGALVIVAAYLIIRIASVVGSSLLDSSLRRLLAVGTLIAVTGVMAVHLVRRIRKEDSGPQWPRLLSCLACVAGLVSLLSGQVEDLIYYACAGAMLISSVIELVMMNRSHNEYASRPVPFFTEKEVAS